MCVLVRIGCGPFGSVLGGVGRVFLVAELESNFHLQNKRENRAKKTWVDSFAGLFLAEIGALVLLYFIFIFFRVCQKAKHKTKSNARLAKRDVSLIFPCESSLPLSIEFVFLNLNFV